MVVNFSNLIKRKESLRSADILTLGILAGMCIAMAGAAATIGYNQGGLLLKSLIFPIGLILVVLLGAELFTGNCLLFAPTSVGDFKGKQLWKVLGFSYLGNFIGSIIIAALTYHLFDGLPLIKPVSAASMENAMPNAIMCNILVCLAVLLASNQKETWQKIVVIFPPIFLFIFCGFEHCIANMYYLSVDLMNHFSWSNLLWAGVCLGTTTIGNIVGGVIFAMLLALLDISQSEKEGLQ